MPSFDIAAASATPAVPVAWDTAGDGAGGVRIGTCAGTTWAGWVAAAAAWVAISRAARSRAVDGSFSTIVATCTGGGSAAGAVGAKAAVSGAGAAVLGRPPGGCSW